MINFYTATSLGALERERKALEVQVQSASEFQAMYDKVQGARKMRADMSRGEIALLAMFKELGLIVPETMTLERFSFDRRAKNLSLAGNIHGDGNRVVTCAEFVRQLNDSPFLDSAKLAEGVTNTTEGKYHFEITGKIHEF